MENNRAITEYDWIDKIANLLDSKFKIPGTSFRFGLDPILGLIPGIGDIGTFLMSSILVLAMIRHGASGRVTALMTINVLIDTLIGGIPIVGNIFDFFFQANNRNLRLLKRHHLEGKYQGSAKKVLIITAVVMLLLLMSIIYLFWTLIVWGIELIGNI